MTQFSLRYAALVLLLVACFHTYVPGPNGTQVKIKTPCDHDIWLIERKYGKPTQVLLADHDFIRIRYYYSSTRTEYRFGWWDNDNTACSVGKYLHLTDDEIK
jgi:hypothetical protein